MDITAPANGRPTSVVSSWGVPWPSDDDLLAEADSVWAIEHGLADPGPFSDPISGENGSVDLAGEVGFEGELSPAGLLEQLTHQVRDRHRATAAEYRLIALLLRAAAADPVPWVGPDPTLDVEWSDSRRRSVAAVRRDRRDMAERAVVAEIATRLRLSEQTVRTRAAHAEMLQSRCPEVWTAFSDGLLSERHAVEAARLATSLPDEAPAESTLGCDDPVPDAEQSEVLAEGLLAGVTSVPDPSANSSDEAPSAPEAHESWRAFDEGALDRALRLPPARFSVAARALRERVHSESLEARHRRAARDRGVWVTPELDGMATLTALLPADRAHAALTCVDRIARHLRVAPDEERTLAQLRADAVADLLTSGAPTSAGLSAGDALITPRAPTSAGAPAVAGTRPAAHARPAAHPRPAEGVATAEGARSAAGAPPGTGARPAAGAPPTGGAPPAAGAAPAASGPPAADPLSVDDADAPGDARGGPARETPPSTSFAARPDRRPTVVVTVPALTLLGAGTEPATLDGYGPIDLDTARRLAGEARSWVRVLTHPLTGVPLALDRSTYRVPTALRRWLGVTSPTCVFPGCGRAARDCDLDHLTAWRDGGATDDDNLAPECRHHHRLRHESQWEPSRDPGTGEMRWTSPLGAEIPEGPPPF
ncbi:hypothetical protein MTES_0161 [Microbacterium testaceum StLB037]|uniref:HNH nuclease domain-containing protein n=1 Tax=Microbacterium testaceum (strain StLB037) TaxID=979556 RepID=E8N8A5_MICTS|nr:HNH endonuclease signature motif containing protein [Microbacterium testaceum]BAJ73125.1 hypothetical protein MTES_0161 [Microbacterium testaceum StLB037]